jgi:hypothetical protein
VILLHFFEELTLKQVAAALEISIGTVKSRLAGLFEVGFFILMLVCMDFGDRFHWFLFFGFLMVYTPMITFTWRNAIKIDHLYYRLIDELKYGGG